MFILKTASVTCNSSETIRHL